MEMTTLSIKVWKPKKVLFNKFKNCNNQNETIYVFKFFNIFLKVFHNTNSHKIKMYYNLLTNKKLLAKATKV